MALDVEQGSWGITTGPGITALGVCAARAMESTRPDRLINDPYAAAFFSASESPVPMMVEWPETDAPLNDCQQLQVQGAGYIAVRSKFFDDFVMNAVNSGARQVVLLGAGLDTRAFRLGLPADVQLFEVDQPGVIEFKNSVLSDGDAEPSCSRTVVGIDLREDWPAALRSTEFDPSVPTIWIFEGLLPYLPAEAEERLVVCVTEMSAPGSCLVLDHFTGSLPQRSEVLRELSERSGINMSELINSEPRVDVKTLLGTHGWNVKHDTPEAVAPRYGRDLSNEEFHGGGASTDDEGRWFNSFFVTAERGK